MYTEYGYLRKDDEVLYCTEQEAVEVKIESFVEIPIYSEEVNEEGGFDVIGYRKERIN